MGGGVHPPPPQSASGFRPTTLVRLNGISWNLLVDRSHMHAGVDGFGKWACSDKKDIAARWPTLKSIFNLWAEITNSYKNYLLQWIMVKLAHVVKKSYFLKENCMHLNQHGHPTAILENELNKILHLVFT